MGVGHFYFGDDGAGWSSFTSALTVAELGAIGRNLNQIARATHQGGPAPDLRDVHVMAMIRVCGTLRDHVKALLKANALSWKVGHADPHS